jgi:hypothetical protein
MSEIAVSTIAFALISGATFLGLYLHNVLPKEHLSDDSKETVKLGMGMVATLAALVLGLLVGFATTSFNDMRADVQRTAANLILLDRALAHYGPETREIRDLLRRSTAARIDAIWPKSGFQPTQLESAAAMSAAEAVQDKLRTLAPQTDAQRWLQSRALALTTDLAETRFLLVAEAQNEIPTFLVAILIFWGRSSSSVSRCSRRATRPCWLRCSSARYRFRPRSFSCSS